MKQRTRIIIPPASSDDWRWREYKGYLAVCGDLVDCIVLGRTATTTFADDDGMITVIGKRIRVQEAAA